MANPFTYLELHSTDATRAKAFYAELFGWKTKDIPAPKIGVYTEVDTRDGPPAGLMPQQEPGARSAWLAYISVPKLDETVARAEARRKRGRAADRDQGRRLVRGPAGSVGRTDRRLRKGGRCFGLTGCSGGTRRLRLSGALRHRASANLMCGAGWQTMDE